MDHGRQSKQDLRTIGAYLQTKSYEKDRAGRVEKKDRRQRDREEGRGELVDDLRQTHRAKPKLDSMSRSVNIKCRRRCAIEI